MTRNNKGGKNHRRSAKGTHTKERVVPYKEADQEYAQIVKPLGECRFECQLGPQRTTILAKVRGKMRKRAWVRAGDWVLCSTREFQEGKVDIIHVYRDDDLKVLRRFGNLWPDVEAEAEAETETEILPSTEIAPLAPNQEPSSDQDKVDIDIDAI